jgi:predicted homoserine dehydrogenase-like protein
MIAFMNTSSKSLKAGVLGAGGMGRTVVKHLQGIPGVSGIVAYDVVPESLRKTEAPIRRATSCAASWPGSRR